MYWYNGHIYGTETIRGLDVLSLLPSEFLSENEIAAARIADQGAVFNPQQQFRVTWPAEPVVAHAYVDQLLRSGAVDEASAAESRAALDAAAERLAGGTRDKALAARLDALARGIDGKGGDAVATKRFAGLAETMRGIAGRLRKS